MNILIVTPTFPPEVDDPATYSVKFARSINGGRKHRASVLTFALEHPKKKFGLEVHSIIRKGSIFEKEARLLKSIIERSKGADVIYSLDIAAIGSQSIIAGNLLNKPVVVRYFGDIAWEKAQREGKTTKTIEEFLAQPDANQHIIQIQKFVFWSAKKIIVPSNSLKKLLLKYYNLPEERISLIPNAVGNSKGPGWKNAVDRTVAVFEQACKK